MGVFTGSLVILGLWWVFSLVAGNTRVMVGVFTGSLVIPGLWWVFSLVAW